MQQIEPKTLPARSAFPLNKEPLIKILIKDEFSITHIGHLINKVIRLLNTFTIETFIKSPNSNGQPNLPAASQ